MLFFLEDTGSRICHIPHSPLRHPPHISLLLPRTRTRTRTKTKATLETPTIVPAQVYIWRGENGSRWERALRFRWFPAFFAGGRTDWRSRPTLCFVCVRQRLTRGFSDRYKGINLLPSGRARRVHGGPCCARLLLPRKVRGFHFPIACFPMTRRRCNLSVTDIVRFFFRRERCEPGAFLPNRPLMTRDFLQPLCTALGSSGCFSSL